MIVGAAGRRLARSVPPVRRLWGRAREANINAAYRVRRERYEARAVAEGRRFDAKRAVSAIRDGLSARGVRPTPRTSGDIHTFAFVPLIGWHSGLLPDLRALGALTHFDYTAEGIQYPCLIGRDGAERRRLVASSALSALRKAHAERPVDWAFFYASGAEIDRQLLIGARELGIPLVNMCLDDKHSWDGAQLGDQRTGQIDIASLFDASWTSARVACDWYVLEGARPIYLPEGFDAATYFPSDAPRDIGLSFVGADYGVRREVIGKIAAAGLRPVTWGNGWGRTASDPREIYARSAINLGVGNIGYSRTLTAVKGRDFEVPATGGGVYLTTYNADLALHFNVGDEILCYRTTDELIELARHYLRHDDEARAIAQRARERCVREHRWLHRYETVLRALGVLT